MLSNNAVKLGVGKALIVKDKEKESNLIFTVFFRCISHFEDIKIKTCRRHPIPEVYEETVTKKWSKPLTQHSGGKRGQVSVSSRSA